jgi:uncharacterized delta-60 repeat protein
VLAGTTAGNDTALARFTATGTPDPTFGTNGQVVTPVGTGDDGASEIEVLPSGKILVAGWMDNAGCACLYLARYTNFGLLDPSFGTNGIKMTTYGVNPDSPPWWQSSVKDMEVQEDGKILVSFTTWSGGWVGSVARFNPSGALDSPGWAADGVLDMASVFPPGPTGREPSSVKWQPDGTVYISGLVVNGGTFEDPFVVRTLSNGTLDNTFDQDGKIIYAEAGSQQTVDDLERGRDGSIFLIGGDNQVGWNFSTWRLRAPTITNWGVAPNNFGTSGNNSAFGVCLRSVADGAFTDGTTWTPDVDGDCADGDGDQWRAVPNDATGTKVARGPLADPDNEVTVRFGLRAAANQTAGSYVAPVVVEVIAPDA